MSDSQASSVGSPPSGCKYAFDRGTACVTLLPELSDVKWDQIEALGKSVEGRLADERPKKVVFDISGLTYMGSAMVALVVRWWKKVESSGGSSVVVCRDPNVLEVLKLASLDEHWTLVPTIEAGYKKLGVSAPSATSSAGGNATASVPTSGSGDMLWPGIVAAVATAASAAGLACGLAEAVDSKTALAIGVAAGVIGAIIGLIGAIVAGGKGRTLSVLFLVLSLASAGATFAILGKPAAGDGVAEPADQSSSPSAESSESNVEANGVESEADEQ